MGDEPFCFDSFTGWVAANKERIERAKSLPYFIKDNKELVSRITEEPKNGRSALLEQIALGIGAEYGSPMTFQEANEMRANPNYKRGGMYQTNCQSSVVANELRRRGLDVEAYGNSKAEWYMPYELGKRPEAAWLTTDGEIPTPSVILGEINAKAFADSMTKEGRYQLWFKWKGKDSGHVITAERLADGTLRYYDAQSGKSAFEFLYSFNDIESGVNVLRLNDLNPNDKIIGGIVKAAKSKAKAPRMTMEQISWWLENAQGATSFMGDFEPYSDEILKRLKKCKTKMQRNNMLESIALDKNATILNDNGKAFTSCYPGHRGMKGETWKNTKQMAIDLNNSGVSVCFLPDYNDKISADAIIRHKDSGVWKLADFKCSQSVKSNTIAPDIIHAFEQADCCVIKVLKADKGILCNALDYIARNYTTKDVIVVNKFGKYKQLKSAEILNHKYEKKLRGFL